MLKNQNGEAIINLLFSSNSYYTKINIDIIELFFSDYEILDCLSGDSLKICFKKCLENNRKDILSKITGNNYLLEKIGDKVLLDIFRDLYFSKFYSEKSIFKFLISNNLFLNRIAKYPKKLVEFYKNGAANSMKNFYIFKQLKNNKFISKKIQEEIGEENYNREYKRALFMSISNHISEKNIGVIEDIIIEKPDLLTKKNIKKLNKINSPLYNILNKENFTDKDIEAVKILINIGLKINGTSRNVRRNINKVVENLNKYDSRIRKQHFEIVESKKLEKTKEAIENIKKYIDTNNIIQYFVYICSNRDSNKVINFCKNKEFVDIIKKQFEKEETLDKKDCILYNTFKNIFKKENGKEFIKNLISNKEVIIENNLSIFYIKKLIESSDKNELNDLINFLMTDKEISQIIKDNIINKQLDDDNILYYTSFNNHNPNYEYFTIKMLENENIIKLLLLEDSDILGSIFHFSCCSCITGHSNINILEKFFKNINFIKKIYDNEDLYNLFPILPKIDYRDSFNIIFNDSVIKSKIKNDSANNFFRNCIKSKKIDILKKLLNCDLADKIDGSSILEALVDLCKINETEYISLLINNNKILEKIKQIQDQEQNKLLVKCFKSVCNNENEEILKLLLEKKEIKEKIPENIISKGISKIYFIQSCYFDDVSRAENYIKNNPNILTKKDIIKKLNETNSPLLYNILNKEDFTSEDIKIVKSLIKNGVKINETSRNVRRNINKVVEDLNKYDSRIRKQHFGIIDKRKLKRTKSAIEEINKYIGSERNNIIIQEE